MNDSNKWAAEWYRKGNDAMQKQNWALAVEAFAMCSRLVPENVIYRQLLRNCTKKKYGDNKKGAGMMSMMAMNSAKGKVKKAKAAQKWAEADQACEEGLQLNPWDTHLLVELAEISLQLDRGEIARFSYMEACLSAPKDKAIHVALTDLLENRGEFLEAQKVLKRIAIIDPNDLTISKRINDLDVKMTERKGKYGEAESTQDVMVNKGAGRGETRFAPGEDKETDLRHKIRKEPEVKEHYIALADHLRQAKRYEDAREVMSQALQLSGNDPNIREKVEDLELMLLNQNLEVAKDKANESADPQDRQQVAALANELRQRRIEVLSAREERYPANMNIKYELALLFMQLQKWPQAIPLLQRSAQDPRLKGRALVALGKSFMYDKKLSLAKGQFERAVPEMDVNNAPETFLECHYLLARVAEETGDPQLAEKHFGEVLVVDYDYKDARDRLEKLQQRS